jgi:hypothetical protein
MALVSGQWAAVMGSTAGASIGQWCRTAQRARSAGCG